MIEDNRRNGQKRRQVQNNDYEVGYGKPPTETRFKKGQSGNPAGRPRRPKKRMPQLSDMPSDSYLETEAYRNVTFRENGKIVKMPAAQAMYRSAFHVAMKGNRLQQRYLMERLDAQERHHAHLKIKQYVELEAEKRRGEEVLEECRQKGIDPPGLLPHPDDIILDHLTHNAYVAGPTNREEAKACEFTAVLRDYCLLRAAHAVDRFGVELYRSDAVYAYLCDHALPKRYRLSERQKVGKMMEYQNLSRRNRQKRLIDDYQALEEMQLDLPPVSPQIREVVDDVLDRMQRRRNQRRGGKQG